MTTDNQFIPWDGGLSPVPTGTKLEVKYRDGDHGLGCAEAFGWSHIGENSDIIAYRLVEQVRKPVVGEFIPYRATVLDEAKRLTCESRETEHGRPEETFLAIAEYWTVYLAHPISPADVCNMMALLKIARSQKNPDNRENQIDGAGYMALAGELLERAK